MHENTQAEYDELLEVQRRQAQRIAELDSEVRRLQAAESTEALRADVNWSAYKNAERERDEAQASLRQLYDACIRQRGSVLRATEATLAVLGKGAGDE